jgi:hypothetical protein
MTENFEAIDRSIYVIVYFTNEFEERTNYRQQKKGITGYQVFAVCLHFFCFK